MRMQSTGRTYENFLVAHPRPGVLLAQINRPRALNALSRTVIADLARVLAEAEEQSEVRAVVLTGSDKVFSAGADIKELSELSFSRAFGDNALAGWEQAVAGCSKPVFAAVNGPALGGGCELALMCDAVYCARDASFGLPELSLGLMPGAGGTQRLTRLLGKARAMHLILTGARFSGEDAERWGVAAAVAGDGPEAVRKLALDAAEAAAARPRIAVKAAKDAINKSQDVALRDGLDYERRLFYGLLASQDAQIGLEAFLAKRKPEWKHK